MKGKYLIIGAGMMVKNQIKDNGVLYQELSIPPEIFVKEWKKRKLVLSEKHIKKA